MAAKKQTVFSKEALMAAVASAPALKPEIVPLPDLNGAVMVKRMTAGDRNDYFNLIKSVPDDVNPQFYAVIFATVDESGQRIFAEVDEFGQLDITEEDLSFVRQLTQESINEILIKFNTINHLIVKDTESEDEEDEDLKNS